MTAPAPPPPSAEQAWPGAASAWWMVALLFLAGIFSVIDRAILNIVVDPIRADLGISDEQIGLLQGLAFGMFYAVMGLPMGLLADRKSRKWLVTGGITLWSAATVWSGFAGSFAELFAARLLVGLGEATLGPCAISMIADMFAPHKRGRPISIYMMGQGLANGVAISLTSFILAMAMAGSFAFAPMLADLAPWRTAFVVFGLAGLVIAALLAATREPARRSLSQGHGNGRAARWPGQTELAYLRANAAVLVPLYLGFALCFLAAYGKGAWAPAMLMRGFDVTPGLLGAVFGPLTMGFAILGPLIGGYLVDMTTHRGHYLARFSILSIGPLLAVPSALAVMMPSAVSAMVLAASGGAIFAMVGAVMFATLQAIVPPHMRAIAVSLTLVLNTLIGAALGPLLIASVTERVFADPAEVGWSIAIICVPALLLASILFTLARRAMFRALESGTDTAKLLAPDQQVSPDR